MTRRMCNRVSLEGMSLILLAAPPTVDSQDIAGPRNWEWGSGDQQAASNLISSDIILGALSQVTRGEGIELSHQVAAGAPAIPGLQPEYELSMYLRSGPSSEVFARDMGPLTV